MGQHTQAFEFVYWDCNPEAIACENDAVDAPRQWQWRESQDRPRIDEHDALTATIQKRCRDVGPDGNRRVRHIGEELVDRTQLNTEALTRDLEQRSLNAKPLRRSRNLCQGRCPSEERIRGLEFALIDVLSRLVIPEVGLQQTGGVDNCT